MDDRRMPFMEHLRELRARLRNAAIWVAITTVFCFSFAEPLFVLLTRPFVKAWYAQIPGERAALNFGGLVEPFWVYVKVALYGGLALASPVIFHQLWAFVAPGLYEKERRVAVPFAVCSALCFLGGAAFCYVFVLPPTFKFLLSYSSQNASHMGQMLGISLGDIADPLAIRPMLLMKEYLDLTTNFMLGFGLVFELPMLILFLSWFGLVTHRSLWRFNKYALVLSFVLGAILTPGDVLISQLMMAMPLIVLYNISIFISWIVTRRREAREQAMSAS